MKIDPRFLIDPDNLDSYLKEFMNYQAERKKDMASRKFWEGKRVLITGIAGFVGSHLSEKLLEYGAEVGGLIRRHAVPQYPNISHILDKIKLVEGNLEDFSSVLRMLKEMEPDVIFHLGAQSFVPTSFRTPIETYNSNITGTANLLEALRELESKVEAIQVAGSSEEYGKVLEGEIPIKETNPLRPMSPYGVSKVATEHLASAYHRMYGLTTTITRGFNHSGPRRGLQFVTSVISRQAARCLMEGKRSITIGNPDSIRDFTHVDDMIQGYLLAVEKGRHREPYNLGHGKGITIRNLVRLAANIAGVKAEVEIDKSRFRQAEVDVLICDYSKAMEHLGYRPRIPLTAIMEESIAFFKNNPELLSVERH